MKWISWIFCFLCGLFSVACDGDDYCFPSVKQEFLTAEAGADGTLQRVRTDQGAWLKVMEDRSETQTEAGKQVRIVSNYEQVESSVRIYAVLKPIAPQPQPAEKFEEGIHTEPAAVTSIWMGYDYLNMLLAVRQQGKHAFHFIEQEVSEPDEQGTVTVGLMLYHEVQPHAQVDYNKRAYASVPLRLYVQPGVRKVKVNFSLHSDRAFDEPYEKPDSEQGEVMTYRFEYIPQ